MNALTEGVSLVQEIGQKPLQVEPQTQPKSTAVLPVTMTEAAAKHVAKYIAKRGKGLGLRLGVRTTGCSGLAYKLEYLDLQNPEDQRFEYFGVALFVDPKSLAYLAGTELDFGREGLNEGFKFNNPNVKGECGCGESFQV